MVIVKIQGGLGNQLFTFSCGYSVAKKRKEKLILDISDYHNGYFRDFKLDKFLIDEMNLKRSRYYFTNKIGRYLNKLINKIKYEYLEQKDFKRYYPEIFDNCQKDIYLDGYWQNYKYFSEFKEDLRRQFMPKEKSDALIDFKNKIIGENSVSIHIRRGDYLNNGWSLDISYYKKAIELVESKLDDPEFYFFSDDLEWVEKKFGLRNNFNYINFYSKNQDIDEFFAMTFCKNNIIANSTFSWWAAWLNNNEQKIVVAPNFDIWDEKFYIDSWLTLKV